MSSKSSLRITSAPPPPPAAVKDPTVRQWMQDTHRWLRAVQESFNRYIQADVREEETHVYPGRAVGGGSPTDVYMVFNAKRDPGAVWRKVEKGLTSWAFRFDSTTDEFEILYSAPSADPIVWGVYLSMNNTGIPSDDTDITRFVDLTSVEVGRLMHTSAPSVASKRAGMMIERAQLMETPSVTRADVVYRMAMLERKLLMGG